MNAMSPGHDPRHEVAATVAPVQTTPQFGSPPLSEWMPTPVPPYAPIAPLPPQPPSVQAKPKRRKTWLLLVLAVAAILIVGGVAWALVVMRANRAAAAARADFAGAERAFTSAYNDWLTTSLDTELNWEETLAKTEDLVADMGAAASEIEESVKSLPGDAKGPGTKISDRAQALEEGVVGVQASLQDFSTSDDVDYDLTQLTDQTDALTEVTQEFNGVVDDWNDLEAVREAKGKAARDVEMTRAEDAWGDVLSMTEGTLQDRQDAYLTDFIAAFDESANAFVVSATDFMDTVNSLINSNRAGVPAGTRAMVDGMAQSVAAMQELTAGLDADTTPVYVTDAAAVVLDLAQEAVVAATGDVDAFNKISEEFNVAVKDLQAALDEYDAAVAEFEQSADA